MAEKRVIHITGTTNLNVDRLTIEGIDPDRLTYTVREYFDPEGSVYEVEHIPTKTKVRAWTSNGLVAAIQKCQQEVRGV